MSKTIQTSKFLKSINENKHFFVYNMKYVLFKNNLCFYRTVVYQMISVYKISTCLKINL